MSLVCKVICIAVYKCAVNLYSSFGLWTPSHTELKFLILHCLSYVARSLAIWAPSVLSPLLRQRVTRATLDQTWIQAHRTFFSIQLSSIFLPFWGLVTTILILKALAVLSRAVWAPPLTFGRAPCAFLILCSTPSDVSTGFLSRNIRPHVYWLIIDRPFSILRFCDTSHLRAFS